MAAGAWGVLQFVPGIAHAERRAPSRDAERNRVEDDGDEPGPDSHARHHVTRADETNSTSDIIASRTRFRVTSSRPNRARNCRLLDVILSQPQVWQACGWRSAYIETRHIAVALSRWHIARFPEICEIFHQENQTASGKMGPIVETKGCRKYRILTEKR